MTGVVTAALRKSGTGTIWTTMLTIWRPVVTHLDLKGAIHVGHSTGGGEVVRYLSRHGEKRASKACLVAAVPPLMVKTAANPGGLPKDVFDGLQVSNPPTTAPSSSATSLQARSTASIGRV